MPIIITRTQVESSNLYSVGYDPTKQVLEIQFKRGKGPDAVPGDVYRYFDVPETEYDNLMAAESKGKYFAANIKNVFRFEKQ